VAAAEASGGAAVTGINARPDDSWLAMRAFDQRRIVEEIERELTHQPNVRTRRRKCLESLAPGFEHVPPVWQLRVGDFRVFYDIDLPASQVHVRAVRRKEPTQRTDDIT
jgi:mRNA-degrading endonuclease RelE of RelBE toxin-antitoxin system